MKNVIFTLLFSLMLIVSASAAELRGTIQSGDSQGFSMTYGFPAKSMSVGERVLVVWEDESGFPIDLGEAVLVDAKKDALRFEWKELYGAEPTSDMGVLLELINDKGGEIAKEDSTQEVAQVSQANKNNETEKLESVKKAEAPAKKVEAPAEKAEAPAKKAEAPAKKAEAPAKKDKVVTSEEQKVLAKDNRAQLSERSTGAQTELAFWESVKDSDDPEMFEAYIAQYPKGSFVSLAKIKLDRLKGDAKTESSSTEVADKAGSDSVIKDEEKSGSVLLVSHWKGLKDEKNMGANEQLSYVKEKILPTIVGMGVELTEDSDSYSGQRVLTLELSRKQKAFGLTSKYYLYTGCTLNESRKFWGEKERTFRGASLVATLDKLIELTNKKLEQRSGLQCLGN